MFGLFGKTVAAPRRAALRRLVPLWRADAGQYVSALAWSPDGGLVAAGTAGGRVVCREGASGAIRASVRVHEQRTAEVSFSMTGRYVASAALDGSVAILEGGARRVLLRPVDAGAHVAWRPQADELLVARGDALSLHEPGGVVRAPFAAHPGRANGVAWRPDGLGFATAGRHGALLWRLGASQPTGLLPAPTPAAGIAFSPNGRRLAGSSYEAVLRVWDVRDASRRELGGLSPGGRAPAWTADGGFAAAVAGSELALLGVRAGARAPRLRAGHADRISDVAAHPTRHELATVGRDQRLCVWSLFRPHEPIAWRSLEAPLSRVAWSPAGDRLAVAFVTGFVEVLAYR